MHAQIKDWMGSDLTVVNAARVSFSKESHEFSTGDSKLLNYLAKHNHWTPFGHIFAQFHMKAPIFVARQLVKHQIGLVWNEVSRRYVSDPPELYWPTVWRGKPPGSIKQGSDARTTFEVSTKTLDIAAGMVEEYERLLAQGVAPEMARMVLPQNMYTEWYWSGSVMAFARICSLRCKPDAQAETRLLAEKIDSALEGVFPVTWAALRNW